MYDTLLRVSDFFSSSFWLLNLEFTVYFLACPTHALACDGSVHTNFVRVSDLCVFTYGLREPNEMKMYFHF